jgi:hypothetical protein
MGGVDFHHLETRLQCALGRGHKRGHHALDLVLAQLARRGVLRVEGDFRWADRLPATLFELDAALLAQPGAIGAGLASGVGQLDAGHGALSGDEAGDALQRGDLFVVPQAKVFGGNAAIGGDRDGFADHQARATDSTAAQVHQVPVVGQAVAAEYWHMGETAIRLGRVS